MMKATQTVYISRRSTSTKAYHTSGDCKMCPDHSREIEYEKLNSAYRICEVCQGSYDPTNEDDDDEDEKECPFCGEGVKRFNIHFPCEESP